MINSNAVLLVYFVCVNAFAQAQLPNLQTPCVTATQANLSGIVISYTIGEMVLVNTELSNGLMITQGIMQPLTFSANVDFECFNNTEVIIYPNPTTGTFLIRLSLLKKGNVQTILYDATGKRLQTNAFAYDGFVTKQYDIQKLLNGVYYLQLYFTEVGVNIPKKCVYTIQKNN